MATPTETRAQVRSWNSPRSRLLDPPSAAAGRTADSLHTRLLGPASAWRDAGRRDRLLVWLIPVAAGVIAGILRLWQLDQPHALIFDETYYVKDAYSYLVSGVERSWTQNANDLFVNGDMAGLLASPEYVVHPPVGKWMIAFGMALFGPASSFGWRFSAAVVGTLAVMMTAWAARRLFRSHTLAAAAGLLLAIDGHHLVLSRTGILDIFLSFWILAAFCALLLDRDDGRRRLAAHLGALAGPDGRIRPTALVAGPWLGVRWWRVTAGICLGLAVGVKWSALAFIAVFGIMTVLWDAGARREAGVRGWFPGAIVRDAPLAAASILLTAGAVYLASWTGWFLSDNGFYRHWAEENPDPAWNWVPAPLRSLVHYHQEAYSFHNGLSSPHPYASSPWSWLLQGRPVSFYYAEPSGVCGVQHCSSAVLSVGNPLIWWAATVSLAVLVLLWAGRRDWRAGAILGGVAAGYLPWFMYPDRTMFAFYAVSFEPFLILALATVLGLALGRPTDPPARRQAGFLAVGVFVLATLVVSAYLMPLWTGEPMPYLEWRLRLWMPSWT
ncbi:phospholipid carrier-dependent glycosyltransferase [Sinomonas notoginsengisoli]|uniref:dolichyl-phosphate-mannose--protein mannosyltransferase n=1 Tax=Sinomonas notoginsengisoli TaxID=1457311 RepID=UPI001F2EC7C5|nr:phospholipid carrier-dependent glycosyltransferase [Sinomonas notoginsengisoli]